ncbi:CU044_5270 family protein [Actinomadura oligospora]|uniref:CU044_5270 family protein n=1 Tax=Actinomadura oligospora TaxID=111804 RepID=UPI00047B8950|nr:CU044_5270 family protein [Actinomadura oligospora]
MDDDLRVLADTLAKPEPDMEAVDRRRHQLQNAMRGGSGPARARRRVHWALGGTGLTAGVAAAAVTVALATGSLGSSGGRPNPSAHGGGASQAATPMSARQVFLAAADSASQAPERVGKYWHLTMISRDAKGAVLRNDSYDQWFRHDGRHYTSGLKTDWKPWFGVKQEPGFRIGGPVLTFGQLRALPSDPKALVARLARYVGDAHIRTSAGELDARGRRVEVLNDLFVLSTQSPVTQKVRAAAFRALADAPEVKSRGRTAGGVRLNMPLLFDPKGMDVVLDPATGRLRGSGTYVDWQGVEVFMAPGQTVSIIAEWTDTLPEKSGPK